MRHPWRITEAYRETEIAAQCATLDQVFELNGEQMASDPISRVLRVHADDRDYYVKTYWRAGKKLRRYMGRTRIRAEWENLLLFQKLGVPTAPVAAYGQEYGRGVFQRGALITEGLEGTRDLADLARDDSPLLRDAAWVRRVSDQLADHTRTLHQYGFVHVDLKWRNILVTVEGEPQVYLIDCPAGGRVHGLMLRRGIIKDLACLDKVAKYQLSRSQRMRFYHRYMRCRQLQEEHRKQVRQVLCFFEGRE